MALLSFENISIGYDNNPIVENLNFEVEQGDYLTVLGENGAGKSTLLKNHAWFNETIKWEDCF